MGHRSSVIRNLVAWLGLFVLVVAALISRADQPDDYVSKVSLIEDLRSNDLSSILGSLNDIKKMSYQGEILPFIIDLWELRTDEYPELPWSIIRLDVVRVELADILLQAESNGKIIINLEDIHRFLLEKISSKDVEVASSAILSLSIIDDENDVTDLYLLAKQGGGRIFRASVVSLASMCNPEASQALSRLNSETNDPVSKAFLVDTISQMEAFKNNTGWCK